MNPIFYIIFNFLTGTACLMIGVKLMSSGLEKANARVMRKILTTFTGNTYTAFATGTLLTAIVQSSAAVTVITVGFVNSGLLKLSQAVGIIYGANIGTTITAQLMSFRLTDLAPPLLGLGLLMGLFGKRNSIRNIGIALAGFGLMMTGLGILNSGVPFIQQSPTAYELFRKYGTNPHIGLVVGLVATMLVQSSTATVGLTIVLFNAGLINFEAALGLTLGDNIGTCVTAQLASLGTNLSARRTAWAHTLYNVIGVLLALLFLKPFAALVRDVTNFLNQDNTRLIANTHTIFNVLSAVLFLPLTNYYVKFIEWAVKDKKHLKI